MASITIKNQLLGCIAEDAIETYDTPIEELGSVAKEITKTRDEAIKRSWPVETCIDLNLIGITRIGAWISTKYQLLTERSAKAFDETMDVYTILQSRDRHRFTIGDIADEFRRNRQPARSCRLARILDVDFVADVYLAAKAALNGIPELHTVFRLVWLEGRDSPDNVPKEVFTAIQQRVGRELLKRRIWPTGVYFTPKGL